MGLLRCVSYPINTGIRVLRVNSYGDLVEDIDEELVDPTDKRVFAISTGYLVDKIHQMTRIDSGSSVVSTTSSSLRSSFRM